MLLIHAVKLLDLSVIIRLTCGHVMCLFTILIAAVADLIKKTVVCGSFCFCLHRSLVNVTNYYCMMVMMMMMMMLMMMMLYGFRWWSSVRGPWWGRHCASVPATGAHDLRQEPYVQMNLLTKFNVYLTTGFPRVLKNPEISVWIFQDLISPEIGQSCWETPDFK